MIYMIRHFDMYYYFRTLRAAQNTFKELLLQEICQRRLRHSDRLDEIFDEVEFMKVAYRGLVTATDCLTEEFLATLNEVEMRTIEVIQSDLRFNFIATED